MDAQHPINVKKRRVQFFVQFFIFDNRRRVNTSGATCVAATLSGVDIRRRIDAASVSVEQILECSLMFYSRGDASTHLEQLVWPQLSRASNSLIRFLSRICDSGSQLFLSLLHPNHWTKYSIFPSCLRFFRSFATMQISFPISHSENIQNLSNDLALIFNKQGCQYSFS